MKELKSETLTSHWPTPIPKHNKIIIFVPLFFYLAPAPPSKHLVVPIILCALSLNTGAYSKIVLPEVPVDAMNLSSILNVKQIAMSLTTVYGPPNDKQSRVN